MKSAKQILIIAGVLLPLCAFAHGQEVLLTLFLPIIPLVIFCLVVSGVELETFGKTVLVVIYLLTLFISFYIIRHWPYNQNADIINWIITTAPPAISFIAFLILRKWERNSTRKKQLKSFLKESSDLKQEE
jgi:cell division protein FtsW (lipid II flippase)